MKKIFSHSIVIMLLFLFIAPNITLAATSKKKTIKQEVSGQFFHKLRKHHVKAPIPKDPKITKAQIKAAKKQAIAGKSYAKWIKGQLKKSTKKKA